MREEDANDTYYSHKDIDMALHENQSTLDKNQKTLSPKKLPNPEIQRNNLPDK